MEGGTIVGLLPVLFGGWLVVAGGRVLRRIARLRSSAGKAEGTVVRVQRRTLTSGGHRYHAEVKWTTADGREMRQPMRMGKRQEELDGFQKGDRVLVRYDPADPSVMELEGWRDDMGPTASWIMCAFGALVCVSSLAQALLG
ncbi:DUF3592 domain-containing protein [Streptomyces sp. B6B3]|uniref:DUF3592 domain-containing protein n=1 Tax=Streptomyces sp. B6B3 TaxID=3153570 RepID=UPI00325EBADC